MLGSVTKCKEVGDLFMFMGEYKHNIDAKGRLIIPSKFRDQCDASVVVTRGFEGCLALYTEAGWQEYYNKLQTLPKNKKEVRSFVRMITSRASACEFDKLGRINIPSVLREVGDLSKECVIVGVGDHIEIWSQASWDAYYNENKDNFDEISESLEGFEI